MPATEVSIALPATEVFIALPVTEVLIASNTIPAASAHEESSNQIESPVQQLSDEPAPAPSVDENLNEVEANPDEEATEAPVDSFDEETFFNSLDLENLVLVEAQRKGKDVYEIHAIDPVTQEICDKPIDLPTRYVDLIISVMTQQENDSD